MQEWRGLAAASCGRRQSHVCGSQNPVFTSVGTSRTSFDQSPTFLPQQYDLPSKAMPQVVRPPASMLENVRFPTTRCGVLNLSWVDGPIPSSLNELKPQQ